MANEITISATLSASKNGAQVTSTASTLVSMSGDEMLTNVQNVGTSAEAVTVADLDTAGYAFFKNMDATNFVEIALDSAVSTQVFCKLLAGEFSLIKLKTTTIYAKADTGAVNLLVTACEL
jgi:hypothetical protein